MKEKGGSLAPRNWLLLDLPLLEYGAALALQRRLVAAKQAGRLVAELLLLVEHPPVFTLGNRGGLEYLKVSPAFLAERGIPLAATERGGAITYHGPGQLLAYPLLDLRRAGLGVAAYVALLEEAMIRTAADFGVVAARQAGAPGVWRQGRKLGSLGLRVRGGIAYHGMALNVAPDLTPFTWIEPCGLAGTRMSSLAREAEKPLTAAAARPRLLARLQELFAGEWREVSLAALENL